MTLPFHPLATIFPPIEGADFAALVENIRVHGVRESIVLLDGQVLDGRNRYRALAQLASTGEVLGEGWGHRAGLHLTADELEADNIWFTHFNPQVDGEPLAFVISKNLIRRHLSESQRAMVAAGIANVKQGERTDLEPSANLPKVDQAAAAQMLKVSERSVRTAKVVKDRGVAEVQQAVESGELSISAAAQLAMQPAARQQDVLAHLPRNAEGRLTPEAKRALAPIVKEIREERQAEKRERRVEREGELAAKIAALPDKRYGVILADPEWRFEPFSRDSGMDRAADNHYPTSVTAAIAARPVADIAADDCALFLWATAPMLPDALEVMKAWGFTYRSHTIWKKDRIGTGYWWRNRHELLLLGTRGNVPAPAMGDQWTSVVDQMVQEHSAKPAIFHEMIEAYFPNLPKIELNARRARPGWDTWGNEAPEDSNLSVTIERTGGAAARSEGSIHPAAATEHANAHGGTASFAAAAADEPAAAATNTPEASGTARKAPGGPLLGGPSLTRPQDSNSPGGEPAHARGEAEHSSRLISSSDDGLEIPAFLKRRADNVAPFAGGGSQTS